MNNILGALMIFGIAAFAGSAAWDGWRAGEMPIPLSGFINPIVLSRMSDPLAFWFAIALQSAIALGLAASGIMMMIVGVVHG